MQGGSNYKWSFLIALLVFIEIDFTECAAKVERYPLSDSIKHYEPLSYPRQHVDLGHSRVRRSMDPKEKLYLHFRALGRNFNLHLHRDQSLFSSGLSFDESSGFSPSSMYEGFLHGDPKSRVHGFIHDNIFEGRINCGDGSEYNVDSIIQYKHLNHSKEVHSVIYNSDDIIPPKKHVCGGAKAETQGWMNAQTNHSLNQEGFMKYEMPSLHQHPEVHHRQRRAFDNSKTECRMLIRGDHTFRKWAGGEPRAMNLMSQYVKSISHIYETTAFSGTTPEGISLKIQRISIIPDAEKRDTCTDLSCKNPNDEKFDSANIGVEKFLDLASLDNHEAYCLAYVFAHRDFSMGVLGLAWIGDARGAGGICDRYQNIQGTKKSLNTGIVTNLNYGSTMTQKVTAITFAHEVGHNFGSQHDPEGTCSPGSSGGGNFIMYAKATSGSQDNNFKFSQCSKDYIWPVLQDRSHCFKKSTDPSCGNRILESGEQCDCGYTEECKDNTCCTPATADPNDDSSCKLKAKANAIGALGCSPSNNLCCDGTTCAPFITSLKKSCAASTDCAEESHCVQTNTSCPEPKPKPDKTLCHNDTSICKSGECSGSICELDSRLKCQCAEEENYCKICCQNSNITKCEPTKVNGNEKFLHSGSPCNNYVGYCDFLNKCRKVDAEGPLARLKKLFFSSESIDNILTWMKSYWWACVLIGLGLILFMAAFIACCSVHTPSSNPNKPPPRHLSLPRNMSRRNNRNASAPPPDSSGYQLQGAPDHPPGYNTALREKNEQGYEMR